MTNAEVIRNLSIDELAVIIDDSKKIFNCDNCKVGYKRSSSCKERSCLPYIKQWLESEACGGLIE